MLTRFGFHFSSTSSTRLSPSDLFAQLLAVAKAAEQAGFDSLWVPDQVQQKSVDGGPDGSMFEAYTLLGALALSTETPLLGALVSPVPFRNPAILAKTVTSLDVVSSGRAVLGIGAGWDTGEHVADRIELATLREREERLEEAVVLCRTMLQEVSASFSGRYYSIEKAWNEPRPVQARLPILVGGGGEKRTLAIAARYADACNVFGQPEDVARKLEVLRRHCERIGRDVSEISTTCSLFPPENPDELCELVAARFATGVEGVVLFGRDSPTPEVVEAWGKALHRAFG